MKLINESFLEIKKSKFYGYLYEMDSIEEVDIILENIKNDNKKARHYPYAYKFNNIAKKTDDKEPSGTCGTPILNVLERNNEINTRLSFNPLNCVFLCLKIKLKQRMEVYNDRY